jgi:succinate dehydrogenase/fumarate reductase flavoprotein subunit
MLYQGAGNIAECVAFGRIAGINAANEKRKK